MLKLRESMLASPARSTEKRGEKVESIIVDKIVKANAAGMSVEQLDAFRAYVRKMTATLLATHSSVTRRDVEALEAAAAKARDGIAGLASRAPAPAAASSRAGAGGGASASASGGGSSASASAPAAPLSDATARGSARVDFAAATAASPSAGAGAGTRVLEAGASTRGKGGLSKADLAVATQAALERTAVTVCTKLEVLPEPRIFAARRKMDELKKGFAVQVAERVVDRARGAEVDKAFAGAAKDISKRAEDVELRQLASKKDHALHNAVEVRALLAEQRALQAQQKAAQLAEEDRFLAAMKAELEAEEVRDAAAKERERQAIAESIADNHRLKLIKDEMARKAVEEEMSSNKATAQAQIAKEAAHRDKYKHIAEKQGALAEMLLAATHADRAKQAAYDAATLRRADEHEAAMAEAARAREADRVRRLAEQTVVLRDMMAGRQREIMERRADDVRLAASSQGLAESVEEERLERLRKRKSDQRSYGAELRETMTERRAAHSPGRRNDPAPGFILTTKSSDYDLESTFKREMTNVLGLQNKKANNSEAVGPLMGFGAEFATALEDVGAARAAESAPSLAAKVVEDPLGAIMPSRVEPRGNGRGISLGKGKTRTPAAPAAAKK